MSAHDTEIDELFARIDHTPVGAEERALIERAVRLAEEAGDEERAFQARLRLTNSAHMTGDTDAMFSAFGWCVGKNDEDPARFPTSGDAGDLLFQYKWMAGRLATNPVFPLAQLDAMHADMSERYRRAGIGQSGVLQSRFSTALDTGDLAAAARYREEREAVPRDEYSHCEACVRSEDAYYFQQIGDEETALRLYDEIFDGGLSCGEEPEASESQALLPFLRAGRFEDARSAHLRSYRVARHSPDNLGIIAGHLVFCAVTGNEARGLAILERQLRDTRVDPLNQAQIFGASLAIATLLDAVVRAGSGDTPVRGSESPGLAGLVDATERPWGAAALAAQLWARAEGLADEFNARNGNEYFSLRVERSRALAHARYPLPIEAERFRPPASAEPSEPVTAEGWLDRARSGFLAEDTARILDAVDHGLAAPGAPAETRVSLYGCAIQALLGAGEAEGAEAALADRLELLRAEGREYQAGVERRLGPALFGSAGPEDLAALLGELEAARAAEAPAAVIADLLVTSADLHMREGRHAEALPLALEGIEVAAEAGLSALLGGARLIGAYALLAGEDMAAAITLLDAMVATAPETPNRIPALRLRAQVHGAQGEAERGARLADELLAQVAVTGAREAVIGAAQLAASLLSDQNRDAEAAARIAYAIDQAELAESPALTGLRFLLGRYQHWAGEHESAVENLDAAFRAESAADAPAAAQAETLVWLGQAAEGAGERGLAYGALSRSVELAEEGEDVGLAARAGIVLGQLVSGFQDPEAVEIFRRALAHAEAAGDEDLAMTARHRLGQSRAGHGDPGGLEDLERVEHEARVRGADWLIADVTDSRARALGALGRVDEAVAAALTAADAYADCGDEGNAAMAELFVARTLGGAERHEESVPLYRAAIERLVPGTAPFVGLSLELGQTLESLGRHAEAAEARSRAEDPRGDGAETPDTAETA